MIQDKISLILIDIQKLKDKLKEIKKDMKADEKIENERYIELKAASKDLKAQVKEFEEDFIRELHEDENYTKLVELKMKAEEDVAHANQKLFESLGELPPKPFDMNVDMENGPVRVQIFPDMRIYLNGREEKKRSV
jgi:hypothetical protein